MKSTYLLIYRALLMAMPRDFRTRYGSDALELTERRLAKATGLAAIPIAARELIDLCRTIAREWQRARTESHDPGPIGSRMTGWRVDLRHAWRSLTHDPAYASIAVVVMAVGFGATTAMFAVADAVLLRPLPYPHGHALVRISEHEPVRNLNGASFPASADWGRLPSLARVGGSSNDQLLFQFGPAPERARGASVSPGFFDALGVQAGLGRVMQPHEPLLDPDPKIVLGHALWQRQFNGDPTVVGRVLKLEARTFTVIGVMPVGFAYPEAAEFWTTLPTDMKTIVDARSLRFLDVIARLAPERTIDDLRRDLNVWSTATRDLLPDKDRRTIRASLLHDEIVEPVRPGLRVVIAGVALLLAAACANIAVLMLARGWGRSASLSMQSALGASRWRLVRQQLLEATILGAAGGSAALAIASAARSSIISLSVDQIPRISSIAIDARVILFTFACAIATACVAAVGPAWLLTRGASRPLTQISHTIAGRRGSRRLFGTLVAAEFAVAVALVAGAALLFSSYLRLQRVATGVDPSNVGVAQLNFPLTPAWRSDAAVHGLIQQVRDGLLRLPDVTQAAFVARLPLDPIRGGIEIKTSDPAHKIPALYTISSEGYFATVGARLVAGRDLSLEDTKTATVVVVINDVLAQQLFGDPAAAIDRTISFEHMRGPMTPIVVGVVEAIRYDGLRSALRPEVYQHYQQAPIYPGTLVYRTGGPPLDLAPGIRHLLGQIDRTGTVTLERWTTLETRMGRSIAQPRFFMVLIGVFASAALLLAVFGIHGALSHWVGERRRELGIRVALGADRFGIAQLVIARGLALAACGIVGGLGITLAGARFLSGLVFGVSSTDPLTLTLAALALIVLAAVICVIAARRAVAVDPIETLKL